MSNIRVDFPATLVNGQSVTFRSPVDCSQITGLVVYYIENNVVVNRVFQFADAHGNNVGSVNLFAENVLVKVILDTDLYRAYVQNADTNAYLEGRFSAIENEFAQGIVCESSGSVISVSDSSNSKLNGLTIYGKTTQNGTPSPANPVPLDSVGESIGVVVAGKNLATNEPNPSNTVIEKDGNSLRIYSTKAGTYQCVRYNDILLKKDVAYTVSLNLTKYVSGTLRFGFRYVGSNSFVSGASVSGFTAVGSYSFTFTPTEDMNVYLSILVTWSTAIIGDATFSDVQLEVGKSVTAFEPYNGQTITIQTHGGLHSVYDSAKDEIDLAKGVRVQRVAKIDSYAGEEIPGEFMSSTGELTAGATVLYALAEPIETPLSAEDIAAYSALHTNKPFTTVYNDAGAYMELEYVAYTERFIKDAIGDIMVKPVEKAWEQRMLERIEQTMIPMVALRKIPKAASGYLLPGTVMKGISYSSLGTAAEGQRLAGVQIPLSTYYSALENPASKMYTEDQYQNDIARSTYYGINCSGFVSYVCGWNEYVWTTKMAELFADKVLPVETENDLFQIRRGDILLNTIVTYGHDDHVMVVQDVVCDRITGKLLGFHLAEAWKPFVKTAFWDLQETLAIFHDAIQPYRLVRLDDSEYGLDVAPVAYSKAVYPDKGDGGKYTSGESVWLYIPNSKASSITIDGTKIVSLSTMNSKYVNGVLVYEYVPTAAGTYTISTNTEPGDPCKVNYSE